MSNIKSYLKALLESTFTSKKTWIGNQGFFGDTHIALISYPGTTSNIDLQYVAPANGYILADNGANSDGTYCYVQGTMLAYGSGNRSAVIAPVRKGGTATIRCNGSGDKYVVFSPILGQE